MDRCKKDDVSETSSASSRPALRRDLTNMIDNMGGAATPLREDAGRNPHQQAGYPDKSRREEVDSTSDAGAYQCDKRECCGDACCCDCCEDDTTSADAPQLQADPRPAKAQPPPPPPLEETTSSGSGLPCRQPQPPCYRPHDEANYQTTNRYHFNHIGLQRAREDPSETALSKFRNLFRNRRTESSSMNNFFQNIGNWYHENVVRKGDCEMGTVCGQCRQPLYTNQAQLPQLYTARVKNTTGVTPERFVFNAVCGIPEAGNPVNYCQQEAGRAKDVRRQPKEIFPPPQPPLTSYKGKVTKETIPARGNVCEFKPGYAPFHQPPERIDIYCFDHQNAGFFQTTDSPPPIHTELMIEKVDRYSTNFWAEIFGFVHIFVNFGIAFLMQLIKFILCTLVRPLMVGTLQLTSDYFLKPLLTILFNGLLQPVLIFIYNVATSFRDLCLPVARGFGYFLRELAHLVKAFRIVETNSSVTNGPFTIPSK